MLQGQDRTRSGPWSSHVSLPKRLQLLPACLYISLLRVALLSALFFDLTLVFQAPTATRRAWQPSAVGRGR